MRLTKAFYSAMKNYVTKIGLEIHARINSKTKIFSDADLSTISNSVTNHKVSFFDAALPGIWEKLPMKLKKCRLGLVFQALCLH
jgi:Asp-tRNA(Asn)/Glu-tRNA(Gln) amidotransferase B subunit